MSAETVLKAALLRAGLDEAAPQVSGSDYQCRQMVDLINEAGRDLMARADWPALLNTLAIAGGASAADLPADFHRLAEGLPVMTGSTPVRCVTSPDAWAFLSANASAQPHFHLAEGQIRFSPALPAEGASARYVSKAWVEGGKTAIDQNADVLRIPENLVIQGALWRWRRAHGMPFDDMVAELEADIATELSAARARL